MPRKASTKVTIKLPEDEVAELLLAQTYGLAAIRAYLACQYWRSHPFNQQRWIPSLLEMEEKVDRALDLLCAKLGVNRQRWVEESLSPAYHPYALSLDAVEKQLLFTEAIAHAKDEAEQ